MSSTSTRSSKPLSSIRTATATTLFSRRRSSAPCRRSCSRMKRRGKKSSRRRRTAAGGGALLFVYGTLRAASGHPMHTRLRAEADFMGAGTFRGRLYDVGTFPGAVASRSNAERVSGEIYRLRDPARAFRMLDAYEDT